MNVAAWVIALIKGLQTALALTSLVLVFICGRAVLSYLFHEPKPAGFRTTGAVLLIFGGCLLIYGWIAAQYWLLGIEQIIGMGAPNRVGRHPPLLMVIIFQILFLTGGAVFVAMTAPVPWGRLRRLWQRVGWTEPPPWARMSRSLIFWAWSILVAALVLSIVVETVWWQG